MKPETLSALLTARVLLERAEELFDIEERHSASAGLVVLQDALELVFYAALIELGEDERQSIETLSFDQLIGALRKISRPVVKSGTLKALNRERVNVKHYGHLAEPVTVRRYRDAAVLSITTLLMDVVGKGLTDISLHELLEDGPAKEHVLLAVRAREEGDNDGCLVELRKALYVAIEEEYSVESWKDYDPSKIRGIGGFLTRGGHKAPWYTRNSEWISKNVREPADFVQLDHDRLRMDLLEWGASTRDYSDVARLTPKVFRFRDSGEWIVQWGSDHLTDASDRVATFCLDRVVSLLAKAEAHRRIRMARPISDQLVWARVTRDTPMRDKATLDSSPTSELKADSIVVVHSISEGFDRRSYAQVSEMAPELRLTMGYVDPEALERATAEEVRLARNGPEAEEEGQGA